MKKSQSLRTILALGGVLFPLLASAETPQPTAQEQNKINEFVHVSKYALMESTFQKLAIKDAKTAAKVFMEKDVQLRWMKITTDFSKEQIADFMTGSIIFRGAVSEQGSLAGFYNPWWDTMLLLWSRKEQDIPKISRFLLLAGESFRQESTGDGPDVSTVVPRKDPIAVEVARRTDATRKRFEVLFDTPAKCGDYIPEYDPEKNETVIQTRSALRLKLALMLMKNNRHYREAYAMCSLLADANPRRMKNIFPFSDGFGFIDTFCKLNPVLRNDFIPYCYLPTENERVYVMINRTFPRLFVVMRFGREADHAMEWYDLNESERLMQIWNSGKAVEK